MRLIVIGLMCIGSLLAEAARNRDPGSSSVRQGPTLPGTCRASPNADVFYKSGASAGLYTCTATNTWGISIPGATLDAVTGASTLTGSNALLKDAAAGTAGLSTSASELFGVFHLTGKASSTLTGTADPTASTTLVGTGTLFLTELTIGDRITVNSETRAVVAIATNVSLTVDTAFTNTAPAAVTRLPAIFVTRNSAGQMVARQNSAGGIIVVGQDAAIVPLTIMGASGQTENLLNMLNSAGAGIANVSAGGTFYTGGLYTTNGAALTTAGIIAPSTIAGRVQINSGTTGRWASLDVSNLYANALSTPTITSVTPTCTGTCASTWTYTVEANDAAGNSTLVSADGTTAANATTLDGTHYNTLLWPAVTGVTSYTVRRKASGGTPATLGKLTTCTAITGLTCVDNGLVGDASAAPAANTTGTVTTAKYATATACASGASPAVCGSAASGNVALPTGGTLTVNTTAVNAASQILITENTTVGAALSVTCNTTIVRTYVVTTITAATSFVITASAAPITTPACLSYTIVN